MSNLDDIRAANAAVDRVLGIVHPDYSLKAMPERSKLVCPMCEQDPYNKVNRALVSCPVHGVTK